LTDEREWTEADANYVALLLYAERLVRSYTYMKDEVIVPADRFYELRELVGKLTGR
jgi:hypothetical protein